MPGPAVFLLLVQRRELLLPGRDILFEVLLHPLEKRLRLFRHCQVEKLGIQVVIVRVPLLPLVSDPTLRGFRSAGNGALKSHLAAGG
jgi:hypothetical protein